MKTNGKTRKKESTRKILPQYLVANEMRDYFYPADEDKGETDFILSALKVQEDGIKDHMDLLEEQVKERMKIKSNIINSLRHENMKLQLLRNSLRNGSYTTPAQVERSEGLEKLLLQTEFEMQREEIECWKDVSKLEDIIMQLKNKHKEKRTRNEIVGGEK